LYISKYEVCVLLTCPWKWKWKRKNICTYSN